MLPNFIIGGASAAGTSFLFDILNQHNDIYLPLDICSEPHFFALSHRYEKGIDWYQKTWFSEYNGQKAVGERSSAYFYFPETANRLKQHLPSIKIIFVLRDPVERAWAQYRYRVFRGTEDLDFKSAVEEEKTRLDFEIQNKIEKRSHDYTGRSLYGHQLERFLKYFSFDQILILNSGKLRNETDAQLNRITNFLEIAPLTNYKIVSDFSTPSVKSPHIQFQARKHFGSERKAGTVETSKWESLITAIRHKNEDLTAYIQSEEDKYHIDQIRNNLCDTKEQIPQDMKAFLKEYFKEDQEKFFTLSKGFIDFNGW